MDDTQAQHTIRLMIEAAAPALLAACKRALEPAGQLKGVARRNEIRAAIEQAEGRA